MEENYRLSLIAAMTNERIIGKGLLIPWRLKEDQILFKEITFGHPVIMGRKTFDSLGKPLIGRRNIIISRTPESIDPGSGWNDRSAEVVGSLTEALELASGGLEPPPVTNEFIDSIDGKEIFIIGGAQIYEMALPLANRLYISRIHGDYDGDIFFPDFSEEKWPITENREYNDFTLELRDREG